MTFTKTFIQDSQGLMQELFLYSIYLTDKIDSHKQLLEPHATYFGYLKDFTVNSGCLCDDILHAVQNDATLLAMICTRVLLEDTINIHYVASKSDEPARIEVAQKWFAMSNDARAHKNELDGKSIAARAKLAGEDVFDLYNNEYARFCNYIHSTAHRSTLNLSDARRLGGQKAMLISLQAYANILIAIGRIIAQPTQTLVIKNVQSYLQRYQQSISLASLAYNFNGDKE